MNLSLKRIWIILLLLSSLLAACRTRNEQASPTPRPELVLTAAALTAQAQLTQMVIPTEMPTPTILVNGTPFATTPTPILSGTPPNGLTPTVTQAIIPGGSDVAEYWGDITIPDGTDVDPGEPFVKVWRLRNAGTSTWTTAYTLAFFGGNQMGGPAAVPITKNVAAGETVDVSVDMVAPQTGGLHRGYWKMRNASGQYFDYAVYVEIQVPGGKPGKTPPPGTGGGGKVSGVILTVDDGSPDGCPHTFIFTGTFKLNQPATVTYRLEAGSDTPGFTFNLPSDMTGAFDAGSHSITYYLEISSSVNAWAQFHVLAPDDVGSNQVTFSLTCKK